MYYKNSDYTVRMEITEDGKRYFIKYHSQKETPEQEITHEIFMLYIQEFNKPMERQKNERRRHIEDGDMEYLVASGKLTVQSVSDYETAETKLVIEAALKTCTPKQKRRFELHYVHGYSYAEIAKMERCKITAVSEAIYAANEKIKKYFS